jgi:uncharacterized membrane protein
MFRNLTYLLLAFIVIVSSAFTVEETTKELSIENVTLENVQEFETGLNFTFEEVAEATKQIHFVYARMQEAPTSCGPNAFDCSQTITWHSSKSYTICFSCYNLSYFGGTLIAVYNPNCNCTTYYLPE